MKRGRIRIFFSAKTERNVGSSNCDIQAGEGLQGQSRSAHYINPKN